MLESSGIQLNTSPLTTTPSLDPIPRLVLFDVGGVLVELSGIEVMLGWLGRSTPVDELWRRWLHSESVRRFETGRIDADEDIYPGVRQMLACIPHRYRRAILAFGMHVLHVRGPEGAQRGLESVGIISVDSLADRRAALL